MYSGPMSEGFNYDYPRDKFFHRSVSKTSIDETWATPKKYWEEISKEFNFELDAAALSVSALCEKWYGPDHPEPSRQDAFQNDWCKEASTIWLNPPYGRQIGKWLQKADLEASHGATVVCLVPARTDTAWWHDYCMKHEYRLIRGRLKFNEGKSDAPFASALIVMR